MLTLAIDITGKTTSDLELALEEVTRLVLEDNLLSFGSNESGSFHFDITGDEEEEEI